MLRSRYFFPRSRYFSFSLQIFFSSLQIFFFLVPGVFLSCFRLFCGFGVMGFWFGWFRVADSFEIARFCLLFFVLRGFWWFGGTKMPCGW